MRTTLTTLWQYWKRFGHTFGRAQTQVVLSLSYLVVFGPGRLALALRHADPLTKRFPDPAASYYAPKEPTPIDLEPYLKQF